MERVASDIQRDVELVSNVRDRHHEVAVDTTSDVPAQLVERDETAGDLGVNRGLVASHNGIPLLGHPRDVAPAVSFVVDELVTEDSTPVQPTETRVERDQS